MPRNLSWRTALVSSTALVSLTATLVGPLAFSAPALAQSGGTGGGNFIDGDSVGGPGGASKATTAGVNGGNGQTNTAAGGGGGGGTTGGTGGTSQNGASGGTGGVSGINNGNGVSGANADAFLTFNGGGGGGGAHGRMVTTNSSVSSPIAGGNGGNGGNGLGSAGGGGGAGGYGVVVENGATVRVDASITGGNGGNGGISQNPFGANGGDGGIGLATAGASTITNGSTISGGNGGNGGNNVGCCSTQTIPVLGGHGGNGSAGVSLVSGATFTNLGMITGGNGGSGGNDNAAPTTGGNGGNGGIGVTGSGATISNSGTITGGTGGVAGTGGTNDGTAGSAGFGVSGSDLTIVNRGSISGASGTNAIVFAGGANTLMLEAGSMITGNVVAFSSADTLALGGSANASFDVSQIGVAAQYQGFGVFSKTGTSIWTLTGATGTVTPWTINRGTLSISSDANLGAPSGGLTFDGGTLRNTAALTTARNVTLNAGGGTFLTGADLTAAGVVTGGGSLIKTGAGTLTLSGANSYTGGTSILNGTLQVSADANLGAASGGLAFDGGTLQNTAALATGRSVTLEAGGGIFQTDSNLTVTGAISGSGSLTKDGAGTLTLTGSNSYQGNTLIEVGTLVGNAASFRGNIGNDGTVVFDQNGNATFAGGIGGSGNMVKDGTGTLVLAGMSTLDWSVDAGDLVSAGERFGGDVAIGSGASFTFEQRANATYAGSISGAGDFLKTGADLLEVTGNSAAFAGATTVDAGTLAVNGTLGGTIDVLANGRLQGNGTVGTTTVAGTIAPGNSIGTLTVDGDYTQLAGSTYEAEIDPDGSSDLIDVTGAAGIEGGTVFALKAPGGYDTGTRYTILTAAGGVTGTYGTLDQNAPFVDLSLAYDPNAVYLDVARNDASFCDVAISANQCAVGDGAEGQGPGNPIYDAIVGLPDEETARDAFDQLSGEIHASIKGAMLDDSRFVREAATNRVRAAFGDGSGSSTPVLAYGPDGSALTPEEQALVREGKSARYSAPGAAPAPADTERFAAWGQAFGSWGTWDSDGNAASLDRSTGGFLVGADGMIAENWRLGLLAGYSRSSFDVDDRASSGDSDNYHLGVYGGGQWGALGLRAGAAYTWHAIETARSVSFPGFTDRLTADYDAGTAQVFGELGYRIDRGSFALEPFGNLAYVNVHSYGFTEDGGAAALTGASGTTDATFTTLGLRASTEFGLGGMKARARGMLGWRHAFGDVTPLADFAFTGGEAFTVAGTPIAEDALVLEAGLDLALSEKTSLGLSYSGQIGDGTSDHGFRADLSVKF
ncbi:MULTISPECIES: autotransporter domain-containing protein [unclassified Mesorhizobium]|uniref:autotransporter domain-containing protein n=1 Tax=unclassified Mesorhizobium TaxID=325217 RepID=UPI0011270779|nr:MULTISPECIES: autotransporter domain-containing protein [unclassified Mesorhizobium]MBZ9982492.1 autotransporter domain-containing protein [Mesorhizobium sp. BR-1-1-8]TPL32252.1 autotransporter outer membrane beta-barrel domain-containing protein [Mesorhizobium sp. B2-4-8]TPL61169.1 autotransporter outer membrane beta-barrel domain-containing protein [Mesorhizobium sp. B2-4-1]